MSPPYQHSALLLNCLLFSAKTSSLSTRRACKVRRSVVWSISASETVNTQRLLAIVKMVAKMITSIDKNAEMILWPSCEIYPWPLSGGIQALVAIK
eukprot:6174557-Pleurochrysis_carterae.AAC.1